MPDNPLHNLLRHHVTGAVERGEAEPITARETKPRSMVWCDNTSHPRGLHPEIWDTGYMSADAAANDPTCCHYPHAAGPTGPEPIVGHPYTIHD